MLPEDTMQPPTAQPTLRPARPGDLDAVRRLLRGAALTTDGVAKSLATFVVASADWHSSGELVGVGGLELCGRSALLRSLAVATPFRGRRLATEICDHLERQATARGIRDLYLLTGTAAPFFAKRGYRTLERAAAPGEIAATSEFTSLCPASATFMGLSLPEQSGGLSLPEQSGGLSLPE
jgi:amino-acid N-acetyltransferase